MVSSGRRLDKGAWHYPTGQAAMYDPLYLLLVAAVSALAAVSLVRPDPLRLAWRRVEPEPVTPSTGAPPPQSKPQPAAVPQEPRTTRADDA